MYRAMIGVVGFTSPDFDKDEALNYLRGVFDLFEQFWPRVEKVIVSGLTDLGVPGLAYHEAVRRGWKTVGIACDKAYQYKCFPVDEKFIIGHEWGDESQFFLSKISCLVRVGGGPQAKAEYKAAREMNMLAVEYDLERL